MRALTTFLVRPAPLPLCIPPRHARSIGDAGIAGVILILKSSLTTETMAPTRTETYAPTRMTDAPSYAPTTDTYAPTLGGCPPLGPVLAADCPADASGLPSCNERGLEPLSLCVGNNITCLGGVPSTNCSAVLVGGRRLRGESSPKYVYKVLGSQEPTRAPTVSPTVGPTAGPTSAPSLVPTARKTGCCVAEPSPPPTPLPTPLPTPPPSPGPTVTPTRKPVIPP